MELKSSNSQTHMDPPMKMSELIGAHSSKPSQASSNKKEHKKSSKNKRKQSGQQTLELADTHLNLLMAIEQANHAKAGSNSPERAGDNQAESLLKRTLQKVHPQFNQYTNPSAKLQDSNSKSSAASNSHQHMGYTVNNLNHLKKQINVVPTSSASVIKAFYNTQYTPKTASGSAGDNQVLQQNSIYQSIMNIQDQSSQMTSSQRLIDQQTQPKLMNQNYQKQLQEQNKNMVSNSSGRGQSSFNLKKYSHGPIDIKIEQTQNQNAKKANNYQSLQGSRNQKQKENKLVHIYNFKPSYLSSQLSPSANSKRRQQANTFKSQNTQDRISNMIELIDSPKRYEESSNKDEEIKEIIYQAKNQSLSPSRQNLQKQVIINQQMIIESMRKQNPDQKGQRQNSLKGKLLKKNYSLTNQIRSPSSHMTSGSFTGHNVGNFNPNAHYQKIIPYKNVSNLLIQSLNSTQDGRQAASTMSSGHKLEGFTHPRQHPNLKFCSSQVDPTQEEYYPMSGFKKSQNSERRGVSSFKVVTAKNLPRKELQLPKRNQSGKKMKRRASSQVKESLHLQSELDNPLQTKSYREHQTLEIGTDAQKSFVLQKQIQLQEVHQKYVKLVEDLKGRKDQLSRKDFDNEVQKLALQLLSETELQQDENFYILRQNFLDFFSLQKDSIKKYEQEVADQAVISSNDYQQMKEELEKSKKENETSKEKLKLIQEYNLSYRKQIDSLQKKLEQKDQLLKMLQETYEKELSNCYSEYEVKKFARELSVLYEQNQELHKINKQLKNEFRLAQEREIQYIKIIQKSPELMRSLELEDSSIIEQKQKQINKQNQEVIIVSSKKVPIGKLDLDLVTEIQEKQAAGQLPPIEDSFIVNKREMKEEIKNALQENAGNRSELEIEERKQFVKQKFADAMESFSQDHQDYGDYGSDDDDDDDDDYGQEKEYYESQLDDYQRSLQA